MPVRRGRKPLTRGPCAVCSVLTSEYNYKVKSCNKCKMIFRRAVTTKSSIAPCNCLFPGNLQCRLCQFYACIRSGMQISLITFKVPDLVNEVLNLNSKRMNTYFGCQMTADIGLEEVMTCGCVKKREKNAVFTSHDWVLMEIYSIIEFIKGFKFMCLLRSQDATYFMKNIYFKCAIYFIAVRSYLSKLEFMTFPLNVDVFPEEISQVPNYCPRLLNRIRCKLISKFIELQVTEEELLILISIIFCDPSAPDLSEEARSIVSQYQNIYARALFDVCQRNKLKSGPERYANIIHLSEILTKTIEDLEHIVTLFNIHQPNLPLRKLVKDSF